MVDITTRKTALTDTELRYVAARVRNGSRTVVNPHPFKFIINNERVCAGERDLFLLVYVHSAPGHFKRRETIRETWGNRKYYARTMKIIFVLGLTNASTPETDAALHREHAAHKDIVQEDFMDSYRNLTYKAIGALKWISTFCVNAKYVLKSDDDMIVNPFTLMRYLEGKTSSADIMCNAYHLGHVLREPERCHVTRDEYGIDFYPIFCSGSAFVMTIDIALALHKVSYSVPFFWVDDVYLTGLLTFKLGDVTFEQLSDKYEVFVEETVVKKLAGWWWSSYIFGHVPTADIFQTVWTTIVEKAAKCLDGVCLPPRRVDS